MLAALCAQVQSPRLYATAIVRLLGPQDLFPPGLSGHHGSASGLRRFAGSAGVEIRSPLHHLAESQSAPPLGSPGTPAVPHDGAALPQTPPTRAAGRFRFDRSRPGTTQFLLR